MRQPPFNHLTMLSLLTNSSSIVNSSSAVNGSGPAQPFTHSRIHTFTGGVRLLRPLGPLGLRPIRPIRPLGHLSVTVLIVLIVPIVPFVSSVPVVSKKLLLIPHSSPKKNSPQPSGCGLLLKYVGEDYLTSSKSTSSGCCFGCSPPA